MGRALISSALLALVMLPLERASASTAAFCGSPLLCRGIQATSSRQESIGGASRRPLRTRPAIGASSRQGRTTTMDVGEDFDHLDGISGMPETIGIGPLFSDSNTTTHLIDYAPQLVRLGTKPGGAILRAAHSILPTGGFFNFAAPRSTVLPEYSLEPGGDPASPASTATAAAAAASVVAPRDHAESAAAEIARKIAEGGSSAGQLGGGDAAARTPPSFQAAAVQSVKEHLDVRERRAAVTTRPTRGPAGIDSTRVPNLWLAVAHSSSLKAGKALKVKVDGVPLVLWRGAAGSVSAMSDVCIHRGASLARGWVAADRLVCPYHGFEFEIDGRLGHMPGAGPPTGSAAAAQASARAGCTPSARGSGGLKAPTYQVKEVGGWIHIFPDDTRPGSVEQRLEPLVIPEAVSPEFRSIEGSMDFKGGVDACVENMLDMLHISFVHTFGNMQDPTPFEVSYEEGFDDPETEALATSRVTFRYRSGSKSFSKVVAKSTEVVVKNEFHLPYRAVIRVYFGENSVKTIEATAVPNADRETTLNWKLYRNFAMTHPLDEGPVNKAGDFLFRQLMEVTLREDKEIVENIYPEYQRGFMNARYDKQVLQYRKGVAKFQAIAAERANTQVESSLQMELLHRISDSQRGLASTRDDRLAILDLIQRLEDVQASSPPVASKSNATRAPAPASPSELAADAATTAAAAKAATEAAKVVDALIDGSPLGESVEGEWHLEFISNEQEGADGWDLAGSTDPQKMERIAALKEAGGEARLFDWNEKGRPLWADTAESIQIINTKDRTLTNRAVYKGWSGLTTTVQLDAVIEPLEDGANRLMVGFHKAMVDIGGIKVTFPHLQRFSPTGWMETTYINQGIRIARGNKGSVFVLTRQPVSSPRTSSAESGKVAESPR